jgi:ribulose-phosphate 3-epimerase
MGQPVTARIAPSLLAADFARIASEIEEIQEAGADLLHLDIMDGHFVPNLTFGPPVVAAIAPHCRIPLDAHLMVHDPDGLLALLAEVPVQRIAVHVETCPHLQRTLQTIRNGGAEAGIAINPASALCLLEDALPWTDFVLVMSVNPGFGGQTFIPEALDRVRRLRRMTGDRLDISVDGGVDTQNAAALTAAGATTLIAGSSIFGASDRSGAVTALREAAAAGANS